MIDIISPGSFYDIDYLISMINMSIKKHFKFNNDANVISEFDIKQSLDDNDVLIKYSSREITLNNVLNDLNNNFKIIKKLFINAGWFLNIENTDNNKIIEHTKLIFFTDF